MEFINENTKNTIHNTNPAIALPLFTSEFIPFMLNTKPHIPVAYPNIGIIQLTTDTRPKINPISAFLSVLLATSLF